MCGGHGFRRTYIRLTRERGLNSLAARSPTASYLNCVTARAADAAPPCGEESDYVSHLDRDNDDVTCECHATAFASWSQAAGRKRDSIR
jgi:hypothetical protein